MQTMNKIMNRVTNGIHRVSKSCAKLFVRISSNFHQFW